MSGPSERWVIENAESLGAWLERRGLSAALDQGRVFIDGRRALQPEQALLVGCQLEVYPARAAQPQARVLSRHGGWVFAEKPAGIATEPEKRGSAACLVAQVARELGVEVTQIHALSRLDLGVSGVVLLALDAAARREALALREAGRIQRRYLALAAGTPEPEQGEWLDAIGRAPGGPRRTISASGQAARTRYWRVQNVPGHPPLSLLALEPVTGRTHQLRVHAAAHAAPLLGDSSYGGPRRWVLPNGRVLGFSRVLLHAAWVKLPGLPRIMAPLPREFSEIWSELDGDVGAWALATELGARGS